MVDYLIVGAGSAGCVLAHRLSEDPAVEVLPLFKRSQYQERGADTSIMPSIVNGNTHAAAVMIGEKVAALLKGAP